MAKTDTKAPAKAAGNKEQKKTNHLKIFFIFWGIVLVIGIIAVAAFKAPVLVIPIILMVAAFSFILMMAQLLQQWEGTVQEIKVIKETRSSGDDDYTTENVTYAFIKLTNGKIKKVRSGGWKVGDHLRKDKWEYNVKVL